MTPFCVYRTDTGEIVDTGFVPTDADAALQAEAGGAVLLVNADPSTQYVNPSTKQLTDKSFINAPLTIDRLVVTASGLPAGTTVSVNAQIGENVETSSVVVDDGSITINFEKPGDKTITFSNEPTWIDRVFKVVVE